MSVEANKEAIGLLNRVALRLEQRGISPAADIEKLRALAHQLESGTSFNINDIIHVELTKYGEEIAHKHYAKHNVSLLMIYRHTKAHEYLFPMWELMNIFGKQVYAGAKQCFVVNKLMIVPESKKKGE